MKSWLVGTRGLKWDREWMIINERGACLSQKQEPRLSLIRPSIDLKTEMMTLTVTGNYIRVYIYMYMYNNTNIQ